MSEMESLNNITPLAKRVLLGTRLNEIITLVNELRADVDQNSAALAGILAKLDGDIGVTDSNYAAIHGRGGSGAGIQTAPITAAIVNPLTS